MLKRTGLIYVLAAVFAVSLMAQDAVLTANDAYKAAQMLQREKDIKGAVAAFAKFADDFATDTRAPGALNHAANLARGLKDYDTAVTLYGRVAKEYPESTSAVGALSTKGSVLNAQKKYDEARATYLSIATDYPKHESAAAALMQVAALSRRAKDYKEALEIYDRVIEEYPNSGQLQSALTQKASTLYSNLRDYAAAAPVYEKLGTAFPGYTGAEGCMWNVINAYWQAKDYAACAKAADAYLASGVSQGARVLQALQMQARACTLLNDEAGAQAALAQIEKKSVGSYMLAYANREVGSYLTRDKKYDKAAQHYMAAATITSSGTAHSDLYTAAQRFAGAKKYEDAIAAYRQYVTTWPKGNHAHYVLIQIAAIYGNNLKDRAKQIEVYQELAKSYPDSIYRGLALHYTIAACRALKDNEAGKKACEALYTEIPESVYADDALWAHAELLRVEKNTEGAAALYEKMIADFPNSRFVANCEQRLNAM